jgi:hypothetical protein
MAVSLLLRSLSVEASSSCGQAGLTGRTVQSLLRSLPYPLQKATWSWKGGRNGP